MRKLKRVRGQLILDRTYSNTKSGVSSSIEKGVAGKGEDLVRFIVSILYFPEFFLIQPDLVDMSFL